MQIFDLKLFVAAQTFQHLQENPQTTATPRVETSNIDDIHLTTVQRVLASHIENLELENKDKTAECELYRLKTEQLQQQLKDLKDKAVPKHSKPLLYKEVQPSTSRPPNVRPEVVYCATNTDMCCMANFVSYLNNLQRVEMNSGALKIIPPAEWTAIHNLKGNSTMFDYLKVVPKAQSTTKLVEGIMQLNNNPMRDVGNSKSQMQLRVN